MTKRGWILLGIVLVLLQIADGVLTWHAIDLGLANEGNSIAVKLIEIYSLASAMLILKIMGILSIFILLGIFYYINRISVNPLLPRFVKITIGICAVITSYDVINWLTFILRQAAFF